MYDMDACFVPEEGEVVKGIENIRQTLQSFINMNGKIESNGIEVIQTSDIALVNTECHSWAPDQAVKKLLLLGKLQTFCVDNRMVIGVSSQIIPAEQTKVDKQTGTQWTFGGKFNWFLFHFGLEHKRMIT
jgi:hypothetical protein